MKTYLEIKEQLIESRIKDFSEIDPKIARLVQKVFSASGIMPSDISVDFANIHVKVDQGFITDTDFKKLLLNKDFEGVGKSFFGPDSFEISFKNRRSRKKV